MPASSTSHANWRTRFHVTLLGLTLCAVAVTVQAAPPATTILSRLAGGPVANGASQNGVLSSDGGSMAFVSAATNLDPEGDTNDVPDLFFLDRNTGVLERFKVTIDGLQPNGDSSLPSLSAGGRYVAFVSDASNLVPGDTNGQTDVFRWDRLEGTVTRVSVADNETQANHFSHGASITADGETISFVSNASNLVNGDTNGKLDIFVRDLVNGSTERVTLSSDGAEANGSSPQQSITSNGRYVSFRSLANNLVADDTNTQYDIFVRDRLLGTTLRASVGDDEQQANNLSGDLSRVSLDGRYVLFSSLASNLVADDTNNRFDIFRRDLLNGTTERVSVAADGAQGNDTAAWAVMSGDGTVVAFESAATNLVANDTNGMQDVFVRDYRAGTLTRVSVSSSGAQANGNSRAPEMSADSRWVVFNSVATNLVSGDTNGLQDIFHHDRGTPILATPVVSAAALSSTSVEVSWSDPSSEGEDGYLVERYDPGGDFIEIARTDGTTFNYTDGGLTPGTRYIYRVRSWWGYFISRASNKALVTLPANVPAIPDGLTATLETAGRAQVSWNDVTGETGFQLERAVGGGGFTVLASVSANTLTYRDSTLAANQTYSYRVRSISSGGTSGPSNVEQVTTPPPPLAPPATPTDLTASGVSASAAPLTWTDTSNNEEGFRIWRWDPVSAVYSLVYTTPANTTSHTDSTVAHNTRYVYYVTAFNSKGSSRGSNKVSIITPPT